MRLSRSFVASLVLLLLVAVRPVHADSDPLRLIPSEADFAVQVHQPRQLVEVATSSSWLVKVRELDAIREIYGATNFVRFSQFATYFEQQFGEKLPVALDRLAGGGIVLSSRFGSEPAPVLLVVQGKDEAAMAKFIKLAIAVVEQELSRQESKEAVVKRSHRGIETWHLGKGLHVALAGSALLVSNQENVLHRSIDLHLDGPAKSLGQTSGITEARKLQRPDPLATLWLNLEPAHKAKEGKDIFELPNNAPVFTTIPFGGWIDILRRSPFLCAGLYRNDDGFQVTIRLPQGVEGTPAVLQAHLPPLGDTGSLPLLEPKGKIYSTSIFLDVSKFWEHRAQLFNAEQLKGLEDFDKKSATFLLGNKMSKMLAKIGTHQRFVIANQQRSGSSAAKLPAYAYVVELRQPKEFATEIEAILRGAALLVGTQVKLAMVEQKHGDVKIVGYRVVLDPKKSNGAYSDDLLPCFATVGDQFLACSTLEICHELIDLLKNPQTGASVESKEKQRLQAQLDAQETRLQLQIGKLSEEKNQEKRTQLIKRVHQLDNQRLKLAAAMHELDKKPRDQATSVVNEWATTSQAAVRTQVYASGGVEALKANEDQLLVRTILNQGLPPNIAKDQVAIFLDLVGQLGVFQLESTYGKNDFRLDLRLKLKN